MGGLFGIMRTKILLINIISIVFGVLLLLSYHPAVIAGHFITVQGSEFSLSGGPFYFAGTNVYYLMVFAADPGLRPYVNEIFNDAAAMGLKVIRTWAFNDGADQWNALQTSPGLYDESVFQGLDYVLTKADEHDIRLILPFVNNWDNYGGMNQYVEWENQFGSAPFALCHDDFYTDADIRQWYRDHVQAVMNRVNTYNGRIYKEDPVILAWELANEPRAPSDPSCDTLNDWILEMSAYVKSIDSNHLLTTGSEGFYDENTGPWYRNGSQGVDFFRNHQVPDIDFCTLHIYPDHWNFDYGQSVDWITEHLLQAHIILGKPFILEEFGIYRDTDPPVPDPPTPTGGTGFTATRDDFFQGFYDTVYDYNAAGSLFWILYHDAYPDYDGFGVYYPADLNTVGIIEAEAAEMNNKSGAAVPVLDRKTGILLLLALFSVFLYKSRSFRTKIQKIH